LGLFVYCSEIFIYLSEPVTFTLPLFVCQNSTLISFSIVVSLTALKQCSSVRLTPPFALTIFQAVATFLNCQQQQHSQRVNDPQVKGELDCGMTASLLLLLLLQQPSVKSYVRYKPA
jgi:hypothetical protein